MRRPDGSVVIRVLMIAADPVRHLGIVGISRQIAWHLAKLAYQGT
jgi:hypothetical protein